jgi:ribosomal protein S15P/S13E
MLIHQRARTLKYFKRIKPKQYDSLLADIGVTKEAVEGELVTRL